ncbi:hypothetical protein B0A50_05532 [Salinomyces thailandicus]|uniref:Uncharacterized protein n=1 Tax=Salinomyces thailandicus TaxID=706561 RepID=A0A4U0TUP2_9PEZI|nr:hypothetical protein B0A50_05532 [Salinomyces thailandica]
MTDQRSHNPNPLQAITHKNPQHRNTKRKPQHKKLPKLPPNAAVSKRPLHRPAIPSPYAGASQPKVVYVSARTPFLSAVKRVEKLLRLSDKRLVQSASTIAKQNGQASRKRKRDGDEDEIGAIAREVEKRKTQGRRVGTDEDGVDGASEEVLLKGTGKAIGKVMEMGCWFQEKEEYEVRIRTGTVGAVDDIEVAEGEEGVSAEAESGGGTEEEPGTGPSLPDGEEGKARDETVREQENADARAANNTAFGDPIPETRIRYVSMLEVAVSLR